MTIKEYAKQKNFEIVGKLTRKAAWEQNKNERWYMDEGNNEYYKHGDSIVITTSDGGIL